MKKPNVQPFSALKPQQSLAPFGTGLISTRYKQNMKNVESLKT